MRTTPLRALAGTAALLITVGLGLSSAAVASATVANAAVASASAPTAPQAPTVSATDGWVRVAHLSPDTKAVDVRIAALAGGSTLYELDNVAYGAVSKYMSLPAGLYTVAMLPAGSNPALKPMISASIDVAEGKASTVSAYGLHKGVKVRVFTDDLTTPGAGQARIRLIQGSAKVNDVNVETTSGIPVASNAKVGTATGYAQIAAGPWMLKLTAKKISQLAAVSLTDGSVTTLLVLDSTGGRLALQPVLDSAAVGAAPVGGVQTGGGYLALHTAHSGHAARSLLADAPTLK